jgi:hypothetical protein
MQARNDSSVVFSLKELRAIETQRVADERAAVERARKAEADAKAAAERAVREAAEAKIAAEREERVRIENARVAAEREMRMQLESKEAAERNRLTAELEHKRLEQEMQLRREEVLRKRPRWMIAVTAIAAAATVALALFAADRARNAGEAERQEQVAIGEANQARQAKAEAQKQLEGIRGDLQALQGRVDVATHNLELAQTNADRKRAADELADARRQRAEQQARLDAWNAEQAKIERDKGLDLKSCANGGSLDCLRVKH